MSNLETQILTELRSGDRTPGELRSTLAVEREPELWTALSLLQKLSLVGYYFAETKPSPTLTYKITQPIGELN